MHFFRSCKRKKSHMHFLGDRLHAEIHSNVESFNKKNYFYWSFIWIIISQKINLKKSTLQSNLDCIYWSSQYSGTNSSIAIPHSLTSAADNYLTASQGTNKESVLRMWYLKKVDKPWSFPVMFYIYYFKFMCNIFIKYIHCCSKAVKLTASQ